MTLTEAATAYRTQLECKQKETLEAISQLFNGQKLYICDWLERPSPYLDGEKPKDLLWCHTGCDILLTYLKQIDRGVYV